MAPVTMATIYKELQEVRNELRTVRYALLPVEKISAHERKELQKIRSEMGKGIKRTHAEVFKG